MPYRLAWLPALVPVLLAAACASVPGVAPSAGGPAAAPPTSAPAVSAPAAPETLTYGYTSLAANQWALFAAQALRCAARVDQVVVATVQAVGLEHSVEQVDRHVLGTADDDRAPAQRVQRGDVLLAIETVGL